MKKAETRGKASACVVGLTREKQAVILVDHLPKPRKLLASAKAMGQGAGLALDVASLRFGRVSVRGKQVDITVNKAVAPALELKLKPVMRAAGHPMFTLNADPALEDEAEDGLEVLPGRAGPGPTGAPSVAETPGTGRGALQAAARVVPAVAPSLSAALLAVARGIPAAVAADPARKPALAGLLADAMASARAGDAGAAGAKTEALRQALDATSRTAGTGGLAEGGRGGLKGPGLATERGAEPDPSGAALLSGQEDRTTGLALPEGDLATPARGGPVGLSGPQPGVRPPASVPGLEAPPVGEGAGRLATRGIVATEEAGVLEGVGTLLSGLGAGLVVLFWSSPAGRDEGEDQSVAGHPGLAGRMEKQGPSAQGTVEISVAGQGGASQSLGKLTVDAGNGWAVFDPAQPSVVLGHVDVRAEAITLMPAGEAWLAGRVRGTGVAMTFAESGNQGGVVGGVGKPQGATVPDGAPEGAPGRPGQVPAEVPARPGPGVAPVPQPPLVVPDVGPAYDPADPDEAELVASMQGRSGTEIQNALNELRARKRWVGGRNTGAAVPLGVRPPVAVRADQPTPRDGVIGGKPVGEPELITRGMRQDQQNGLKFQAASEDAMAAAGYSVVRPADVRREERLTQQESDKLAPGELDPLGRIGAKTNPDARIGGFLSDMVAPISPKVDGVRDVLSNKVRRRQAYRLVLNLGRTSVTREEIEALLRRRPISGLQELFIIEKDGAISRVYPQAEQISPAKQAR